MLKHLGPQGHLLHKLLAAASSLLSVTVAEGRGDVPGAGRINRRNRHQSGERQVGRSPSTPHRRPGCIPLAAAPASSLSPRSPLAKAHSVRSAWAAQRTRTSPPALREELRGQAPGSGRCRTDYPRRSGRSGRMASPHPLPWRLREAAAVKWGKARREGDSGNFVLYPTVTYRKVD